MKQKNLTHKKINPEIKLTLLEGTPVYITLTRQIAFYDGPTSIEGTSRIKNVGVVSNDELRKPTAEEFLKWGEQRGCTKEELEKLIKDSENWEKS